MLAENKKKCLLCFFLSASSSVDPYSPLCHLLLSLCIQQASLYLSLFSLYYMCVYITLGFNYGNVSQTVHNHKWNVFYIMYAPVILLGTHFQLLFNATISSHSSSLLHVQYRESTVGDLLTSEWERKVLWVTLKEVWFWCQKDVFQTLVISYCKLTGYCC